MNVFDRLNRERNETVKKLMGLLLVATMLTVTVVGCSPGTTGGSTVKTTTKEEKKTETPK
jgi:hypothetical protein